jgi:hypothetical protein
MALNVLFYGWQEGKLISYEIKIGNDTLFLYLFIVEITQL